MVPEKSGLAWQVRAISFTKCSDQQLRNICYDMLTVCLYLSTFPLLCDEFEVLRPNKVGQLLVKQYHSTQHKKKFNEQHLKNS